MVPCSPTPTPTPSRWRRDRAAARTRRLDVRFDLVDLWSERGRCVDVCLDPATSPASIRERRSGDQGGQVVDDRGELVAELRVVAARERGQRDLDGPKRPIEFIEVFECRRVLWTRRIRDRLGVRGGDLRQCDIDSLDGRLRNAQLGRFRGPEGLSLLLGARPDDEGEREQREEPGRSAGHGAES